MSDIWNFILANWEPIVSVIAIVISVTNVFYTWSSNKKNARFVLFSQFAEIRAHINLLNIEWEKFRLEWYPLDRKKKRNSKCQCKYDALTAALNSLEIAMLNHYEHIAIIVITFDKEEAKYAYDVYAEEISMVLKNENLRSKIDENLSGYPYLLKVEKVFAQLETEQLDKRNKEFVKIRHK